MEFIPNWNFEDYTNNNDDIILDNIKNEIIEINNLLKEDINNNTLKNNIKSNSTFIINEQNNIKKMNDLLNQENTIINNEGIISIDEMSIITNRACIVFKISKELIPLKFRIL